MTDPVPQTNEIAEIARRLSKAQSEVLCTFGGALADLWEIAPCCGFRQRRTNVCIALKHKGLLDCQPTSPFRFRLTPLGLAVKRYIEQEDKR